MNEQRKKLIAVLLIGLLLGFVVGFGVGAKTTLTWGIRIAKNFINIEIDEDMLANGIMNYKNNINKCFKNETWQP